MTGEHAVRRMRNKMLLSDSGRRIIRERPRITGTTINLAQLGSYPTNTLGSHYHRFFSDHNILPDTRAEVQYIADDELAYVMQRYRECHDFMHVLSGLQISVIAELGLKWFEFRQTGLPMTFLGATFGPLMLPLSELHLFYTKYLPWAELSGKQTEFFMNVIFEEFLAQDIQDVRRSLRLIPFPDN